MNVLDLVILIVYLCIVYLHRGEEISEKMLDHKMPWFGMKLKTAYMHKKHWLSF